MATYTVRSGDTLTAIAQRHHTTVSELARANQLTHPDRINAGQTLNIPDSFTPGASASIPQGDLKRGTSGEAVRQLQDALVKLGNLSAEDLATGPGTFGPHTEAALKAFQSAHGVPSTGYYGPLTRAALSRALSGASNGQSPATQGPGPVVSPAPSNPKGGVSLEQLQRIMPNLSRDKAARYLPYLNQAMAEAHINTPSRQAAFLAQLAHESGELKYMEEIASGSAYEGRRDLGNVRPGDGTRYKGRGPIQLTGRANYSAAGRALGIDLEGNPQRAADPDVAFRVAGWYWTNRNLNSFADSHSFDAITYRVNGGYNGKASRDAYYARARQVLGD